MTEQEMKNAIATIATHYGMKAQSMQACEECAELIQAVSKLTRGVTEMRILALVEEIADVRIMMSQLMQFYGIPEPEVSERIDEKLKRQLERISMPGTDLSSAQYLAKKEADRLLARLGGKE